MRLVKPMSIAIAAFFFGHAYRLTTDNVVNFGSIAKAFSRQYYS